MTNAHSDENPLAEWRAEIREFCDDIRQQLSTISDKIALVEQERTESETIPEVTATNTQSKLTLQTSAPISEPTNQPIADDVVNVDSIDESPSFVEETSPLDETEDRLQTVRRELQAMLNASQS